MITNVFATDITLSPTDTMQDSIDHLKNASTGEENAPASTAQIKWSRRATLRLIELYKDHKIFLNDHHYKKKTIWEMIATKMTKEAEDLDKMVYTWKQVGNRWKNMTKLYRDCLDANLSSKGNSKQKCPYYDEISSVYSLHSQEVNSNDCIGTSKMKNTAQVLMRDVPASDIIPECKPVTFVSIAPKQSVPLQHVSSVSSENGIDDINMIKRMKYSTTSEASHGFTHGNIIDILKHINEERIKEDKIKMERLEKMHADKMDMFVKFLNIIKQSKKF